MDDVTELRLDRRLGSGAVSGQGLLRSRSGAAAANGNGTASNGAVANGSGNDASASGAAASGNGGSGAAASGSNGGSGESGGEEPEGGDAGPGGDNGGPGGDAGGPAGDDEDGGAPLPFQEALQSLRRTARVRARALACVRTSSDAAPAPCWRAWGVDWHPIHAHASHRSNPQAAGAPRHEHYQATKSLTHPLPSGISSRISCTSSRSLTSRKPYSHHATGKQRAAL